MKYPRITYAELINAVYTRGRVDSFMLIVPIMYAWSGTGTAVNDILSELGYTIDNLHSCYQFELDYLNHSADKVLTRETIFNILYLEDSANIDFITGVATKEDVFSSIESTRLLTLKYCVEKFMARSWENISRIYEAYTTQYKPLENYSMIEDTDYTPKAQQTVKSSNKSKTDTKVDTGVYGFNSTTAVPSSTTDSNTRQEKADNEMETTTSYDGESDNTHHERSGNIGVTTSQQMLESEIKLRKLEILELIFQGLDEVICQSVYD